MNEGRPPHHRRHPSCIYVYIYLSRMARRGEPWRGCRSAPHTRSLSLSVTALNGHMFTGHGWLWSPTQLSSAIKKPFLGILEPYPGNRIRGAPPPSTPAAGAGASSSSSRNAFFCLCLFLWLKACSWLRVLFLSLFWVGMLVYSLVCGDGGQSLGLERRKKGDDFFNVSCSVYAKLKPLGMQVHFRKKCGSCDWRILSLLSSLIQILHLIW